MTTQKRKFTRKEQLDMAHEERDYVRFCKLADPTSGELTPQDRETGGREAGGGMMGTKQDLFLELDRFFNSNVPGTPPQPVQLFLEWAEQTDLSAHHINAVGIAFKKIIAAMANSHYKQVAHGSKIRLRNVTGDIYTLRADLDTELDRWYRQFWDKAMDRV